MSEKSVKPSKKTDIIKVVLAILAVLLGTYIFVDPSKSEFEFNPDLVKKIDSLQVVNDSLSAENAFLDSTLDNYTTIITELDWKMSGLVKAKNEAKEVYIKKLKELEGQSDEQLDSFFVNRYQYVTDPE